MKQISQILAAALPLYATAFAPASQNGIIKADKATSDSGLKFPSQLPQINKDSALDALATTELPEKLYFEKEKEFPKVLGGIKIGLRKLVVVTGASSGLGLNAAATLAKTGRYFVVMACRDVEKGKKGKSMIISAKIAVTIYT